MRPRILLFFTIVAIILSGISAGIYLSDTASVFISGNVFGEHACDYAALIAPNRTYAKHLNRC